MKKLLGFIAALTLAGITSSVMAQGPVQVINSATNLACVSWGDTTNTPIIANVYDGLGYTVANSGGGTNVVVLSPPQGASFTIFTNASGGISIIQKATFAPSGYRVGGAVYNPNAYSIGLKFSGNWPTGAPPDTLIYPLSCKTLYFEDGYNGPISARAVTNSANNFDNGSLTYMDFGN